MPQAKRKPQPKHRKTHKRKPQPQVQTTALAKVETPTEIQSTSAIPAIKGTVENLERVRRFVSKCLNADLQAALAKVPAGKQIEQAVRERLEIDWGTIPGIDKPFLKQPGAEKFLFWLNLRPEYHKREIDLGNGHLEMVASCTFYSKKTQEKVFDGPDCSCTTMESNYRFRFSERDPKPPQDECERLKFAGLGRFRKKKKWAHGQFVGEEWVWEDRIENPNIYDERNKVRQQGQKRALCKGVRNMGAISEIFTADPSEWHIPDEDDDPKNDQDYTEGGRQIITPDGTAPSGRPVGYQHTGTKEAAQEVGRQRAEELKRTMQEREKSKDTPSRKGEASQNVAPRSASTTSTSPAKIISVTIPSDGSDVAYVSGDLDERMVKAIKTVCEGIKLEDKDIFVMPVANVEVLANRCKMMGYGYQEVSGLPSPNQKSAEAPKPPARAPEAAAPSGAKTGAPSGPDAPTAVSGTLRQVKPNQVSPKSKKRYYAVLIDEKWLYAYNQHLWLIFDQIKPGKQVEVTLKDKVITGFVRVGTRQFENDGLTPILQNSEGRPAPGKLFE